MGTYNFILEELIIHKVLENVLPISWLLFLLKKKVKLKVDFGPFDLRNRLNMDFKLGDKNCGKKRGFVLWIVKESNKI